MPRNDTARGICHGPYQPQERSWRVVRVSTPETLPREV